MLSLLIALLSIPAWAFGTTLGVLVVGSYLMQTGVQGAFGVIPAHLNELSPDAVRSSLPGTRLSTRRATGLTGDRYRVHVARPLRISLGIDDVRGEP